MDSHSDSATSLETCLASKVFMSLKSVTTEHSRTGVWQGTGLLEATCF